LSAPGSHSFATFHSNTHHIIVSSTEVNRAVNRAVNTMRANS
jgi:hypothetical protein